MAKNYNNEYEIMKRGYELAQKDAQKFIKDHICTGETVQKTAEE